MKNISKEAKNKILEHYMRLSELIEELDKHLSVIQVSAFSYDYTKEDLEAIREVQSSIPKNLTKGILSKYEESLPNFIKTSIKKRKALKQEIDKLVEKELKGNKMKEELLKIFVKDEMFSWVLTNGGYTAGNMLRAISDCSNGADLIYREAYGLTFTK